MSSLAAQLAQSASLNTTLLADRSRRKAGESYLFTGREADQHDLESIHSLGVNGLLQLALLNPALRKLEDKLFSEHAKSTDRTLLSSEANVELDASITTCLALLGPYLMETPTGKVLEWLVRRFRINEFNVEAVLSLFLPYHESAHFTKMISIIHIKQNSTWSFLLKFKSAAQNLPRLSLVTEMLRNSDVSRFVTHLLPTALKNGYSHRVLLAFNAACLHDFILRSSQLDEGTVAYLLPALLEPLQHISAIKDAILGTYILLSALSQKCKIAPAALNTILGAMAKCANQVSAQQFTNAALSVCEPQAELEHMSDATFKAIIGVANIEKELSNAAAWIGIEKLLRPLLPGLVKRIGEERALHILESIIATPKVPSIVIQRSAELLVNPAIKVESTSSTTSARRVLAIIQQRNPATLNQALDETYQKDGVDEDAIEQLRISLTVVQGAHSSAGANQIDNVDVILASTNADSKVRATAVHGLLTAFSRIEKVSTSEMKSIHSALLARVQDTNQAVVDVLYSQPLTILPVFIENTETYINRLSGVLSSSGSKPKRSLVRSHLTFLASQFCPANSPHMEVIFQQIVFPFLLFSKRGQHTAELAWDIISTHSDSSGGLGAHEWIVGCASTIKIEKEKTGLDTLETMNNINIAVASQIASNILRSNRYTVYLDALITKLQDANSHVKVLSYLITRSLLEQLSGEHQIEAARRVLEVIGIEEFAEIEELPQGNGDILESLSGSNLGKIVVAKPSSRKTSHLLQIAIISQIPSIPRPTGLVLNWLGSPSSSSDPRGSRYVGLFRSIYQLANVSTSAPLLTTNILRALFISLKDDALAFLSGIWVGAELSIGEESELRTVALYHAAAFLEAHVAEEDGVDFQTILPSLLVALRSHDAQRRQAVLTCISRLYQLADLNFTSVYGFDTIYGKSNDELQYLDRDDFKRYLGGLVDHQDHLAHDVDYIKHFHLQHLGKNKADKKRDTEYKRRLLCFVASHINALELPVAQGVLLKAIDVVSDSAKAHVLLPTIKTLVASASVETNNVPLQELASLAISCFDLSVAKDLNDAEGGMWEVFVAILRCAFTPGIPATLSSIVSRALENGLFSALSAERKITLCDLLLEFGAQHAETYSLCKQLLSNVVEEVPLIIHLLDSLQPGPIGSAPRATKRAKTAYTPEDALHRLSLFVEILGTKTLPGSLDLISHLLETLNRVLQSVSASQADVSYIEQLLMSAIENAANKIVEIPNLSPSVIRLDILVELIRVADNPQTFHQALLLMANLARLAPDSVLHNVMPVFTFMGSNIFHRDDTYSFKVVQQTIDSIVPVMVSSLRRAHTELLDLYIGSKDFLRVFTDAANHIPRHRRTNFFVHLIDVLGSEDFLPPICMLLVEKVANRIVRQNPDDVQSSLALPSSIIQHRPILLQIRALTSILRESQRLANRIVHPEIAQPTFLEVSNDEDPTTATMINIKRRAQALILFVGYALKAPTPGTEVNSIHEEDMGHLVSALISLATLQGASETKVEDISNAARSSLKRVLSVMSAPDFISAVLSMIQSGDRMVQAGAMNLFSERLPHASSKTRVNVTPTIIKIIGAVRELLKTQADQAIVLSAFSALRSIGLTMCAGEEASLTETVPLIIAAIKGRTSSSSAMAALSPLPTKLGPRIIPHFREIISQSVAILREGNLVILDDTYSVLHGLLVSIPTFWGAVELTQAIILYIDHCASTSNKPSAPMLSLMKSVAKRTPTKALLSAMIEMWSSFKVSPQMERLVAYFDLLARALRSATRPAVLEQLRALFKVFLESFDISKSPGKITDVESQAIVGFKELVVKLNEAAFRPLFRRLYDWAFASETDDIARRIAFCHIYIGLLDFFRGLMNPYMSFLLDPFVESLRSFSQGLSDNQTFWTGVVETITKSLVCDDGAFWRDDKLRQLASPLIKQIPVCNQLNLMEGKVFLQDCLVALVDSATDDMLLKAVNLEILMYTRSEDVRLRLFALTCSEKLWKVHGGKLLGFVAETTTFIAECTEDENDMVVRESFRLKDAVERVAGNINGL